MPKLLQINSCSNMLSTGHITESIGKLAIGRGWDAYVVFGARGKGKPSCMHPKQADSMWQEYLHFAESLFLDRHGLASRYSTTGVVQFIKDLQPDVVQLHNLHGYYMNYKILFEFLNNTRIPVVWTLHDCWSFTGHCAHFVTAGCEKWKTGCYSCPLKGDYPKSLTDYSRRNYNLKKSLFSYNENLHIVAVSEWQAHLVRQSFLKNKPIHVIRNGIDLDVFRPMPVNSSGRNRVLCVSSVWSKEKGLYDIFRLRDMLDKDRYEIVIIGLKKEQMSSLPAGIVGVRHTSSIKELVEHYNSANVLVNPTYADTFPTVNLEALASGIPVITYRTGGSPEAIDENTGVVVEQGDVEAMAESIKIICSRGKEYYLMACRLRAEQLYNKNNAFEAYMSLYRSLIGDN